MANFELAGRCLRVAWAQDQSKPALSVLPPGLTAAAAAAQAAANAAKAASSAAGGAAAAAAAARLTAAGQLQPSSFGNGTGRVMGVGGADAGQAAAVQRAEVMRRISEGRIQAAMSGAAGSRCVCLMVSRRGRRGRLV